MVIDIISFTAEQFALLSDAQLLEVKTAQLEKNRLSRDLEEKKQAEKNRLVENGTFLSELWNLYCAKLQEEYEVEVQAIRDSLLFYLQFSMRADADQELSYTVDYALPMEERLAIVKGYYETTYTDAKQRFEAFAQDKVAVAYLGELYAPLYDYFLALAKD
ncbi:MAG: hypothetical protein J6U60_00220 [Clostridia bacterium]|nr:hypothetical protein [Clostridia bacterium]